MNDRLKIVASGQSRTGENLDAGNGGGGYEPPPIGERVAILETALQGLGSKVTVIEGDLRTLWQALVGGVILLACAIVSSYLLLASDIKTLTTDVSNLKGDIKGLHEDVGHQHEDLTRVLDAIGKTNDRLDNLLKK